MATSFYLPSRMLKITCILLGFTTLFSCREQTTQSTVSLRDSVLQMHLAVVDSIPEYDTSALDFQLLMAYQRNDSAYLAKYLQKTKERKTLIQKEGYKQYAVYPDSCIHQLRLHETSYEEAYRFKYFQAFCPYKLIVTVGRTNDTAVLQCIVYKPASDTPWDSSGCRIVNQFTKRLSPNQWDELRRAIKYADFWALKSRNDVYGADGRTLEVEGYLNEKTKVSQPPKYHAISRWLGARMAIIDAFDVALRMSGNKEGCYVVR